MLKEDRLNLIVDQVIKDKKVLLPELSTLLNVSEDTVRRDIKELSDRGVLKAVRGGAVAHSPNPLHFRARQNWVVGEKKIIASKAAGLLKGGQVVFFDGGTTTLALAEAIPESLKITVVTNSFPVAAVLEDHPTAEVIFAGGRLSKTAFATVGYETIRVFEGIHADCCFLGICSIHPTLGVTALEHEDALLKSTMVRKSRQVFALATIEKLDTAEPYFVCPGADLAAIVTDAPEDEKLEKYRQAGLMVI
jgi:DeoR/GlpR family transcriptional regulator of sugar metabolism